MPSIDQFQAHTDLPLTQLAVEFRQPDLIADEVVPRTPVGVRAGKYWVFGDEALEEDGSSDLVAMGSKPLEVSQTIAEKLFAIDHRARSQFVEWDQVQISPALFSDRRVTETLAGRTQLGHEIRSANLVMTAANYPAGHVLQLAGTDQWSSNDVASDPIANVETAKSKVADATGREVNVMAFSRQVLSALRQHPKIRSHLGLTDFQRVVTLADLQAIFDIDRIVVGRAIRTIGGVKTPIWGKSAALLYVAPASLEDQTFARTFIDTSALGTIQGESIAIFDKPEERGRLFQHRWFHAEVPVKPEGGFLIQDVIT